MALGKKFKTTTFNSIKDKGKEITEEIEMPLTSTSVQPQNVSKMQQSLQIPLNTATLPLKALL